MFNTLLIVQSFLIKNSSKLFLFAVPLIGKINLSFAGAYYGDGSVWMQQMQEQGKPVMLQNMDILN